jgi:hypothetical protein
MNLRAPISLILQIIDAVMSDTRETIATVGSLAATS